MSCINLKAFKRALAKNIYKAIDPTSLHIDNDIAQALLSLEKELSKEYGTEFSRKDLVEILDNLLENPFYTSTISETLVLERLKSNYKIILNPKTNIQETSGLSKPAKADFDSKIEVGDNSFLYRYFGTFAEVRNVFKNNFKQDIVRNILLDLENFKFVDSVESLNENIRKLLESYVDTIKQYLESIGNEHIAKLITPIYDIQKVKTIRDVFNPEVLDFLSEHWEVDDKLSTIIIDKNNLKYRAYLSFVALMTFDNLLKSIFGKTINIEREGVFDNVHLNNYNIVNASTMITKWMVDDDTYNEIEQLSGVVKLLISTFPKYVGDKLDPVGNLMDFNDVQQLYSKILLLSNYFSTVIPGDSEIGVLDEKPLAMVSPDTPLKNIKLTVLEIKNWLANTVGNNFAEYYVNKFVRGKNLSLIISATRTNPTIGLPILFYILNRKSEWLLSQKLINNTQYNALKGLYYNVFDLSNTNRGNNTIPPLVLFSLKQNVGSTLHNKNYYNSVCQTLISSAGINRFLESLKGDTTGVVNIKDTKLTIQLKLLNWELNAKYSIKNTRFLYGSEDIFNYRFLNSTERGDNKQLFEVNFQYNKKNKLRITLNTQGKIVIYKNGLEVTENVVFDKSDLISLRPFFLEALGLNFKDSQFTDMFILGQSGDINNVNGPIKTLLEFITGILYIAEANRTLNSRHEAEADTFYDAFKNQYFEEGSAIPSLRKGEDVVQTDVITKKMFPVLQSLSETQQFSEGSSSEGTGKSGDGSLLALQGLNMLGTILRELFDEQNSKADSATKGFSILKAFNGLTIKRGVDSWDGFKNSLKFNALEHFSSSFLYDFWASINKALESKHPEREMILIHSAVISDKSNIPYILIPLSFFGKVTKTGFSFHLDLPKLKAKIEEEFGNYYSIMWNNIVKDFKELGANFNPLNNFTGINTLANLHAQEISLIPLNWAKLRKNYIKKVLHDAIVAKNSNVEIIEGLHYWFDKEGFIRVNPTIINQLYRWGKLGNTVTPEEISLLKKNIKEINQKLELYFHIIDKKTFETATEEDLEMEATIDKDPDIILYRKYIATPINTLLWDYQINETAKDFWKRKEIQVISDLIQLSPRPITIKKAEKIKPGLNALNTALVKNNWTLGSNMILLKIFKTSLGVESQYNITSLLDLNNWWPLELLQRFAEELQIDFDKINIDNAKFDLLYTLKLINSNWKTLLIKNREKYLGNKIIKSLLNLDLNPLIQGKTERVLKNKAKKEFMRYYGITSKEDSKLKDFEDNWNNLTKNSAGLTKRDIYLKYAFLRESPNFRESYTGLLNDSKLLQQLITAGLLNQEDLEIKDLDSKFKIQVNPEIARYNALDFWMGEEFTCATVGTFANHPFKNNPFKTDVRYIEAEQYGQETKRTVTISSSKHAYARGLINGIKRRYTVAVAEDLKDAVYNVYGKKDSATPLDGATFGNALTANLENNSLLDLAVGEDRKPIAHAHHNATGSGKIVKTAMFVAVNSKIRDCYNFSLLTELEYMSGKVNGFYGTLNKHMNKVNWTDELGNVKAYNWTKSYQGTTIKYKPSYVYNPYNKKHYKIIATFNEATQNTSIQWLEVTSNGEETGKKYNFNGSDTLVKRITSNWDLWKYVFGGEFSEHIGNDGRLTYEKDVTSFDNLTNAAIYVADSKLNSEASFSSDDLWLPLKECCIDYIITAGAIKQGAANVNTTELYTNSDYNVTTMKLDTFDLGIQLNAEHHADEAKVSLMTLVVNAIGARGFSYASAEKIYNGLCYLTESSIKDILNGLNLLQNSNDVDSIKNAMLKVLVKVLEYTSDTDGNILNSIAANLKLNLKSGNLRYSLVLGDLPLSHPAIYNQIVRKCASELEKVAVRIKFPGGMDVLNPSNGIYLLIGNDIKGRLSAQEIAKLQEEANAKNLKAYEIKLERSYYIENNGQREVVFVGNPEVLWNLRNRINKENLIVHEAVELGRELGTYDAIITTGKEGALEYYTLFDLASIHKCYKYQKILDDDSSTPELKKEANKNLILSKRLLQLDLNALGSGHNKYITVLDAEGKEVRKYVRNVSVNPYEIILPKHYETTFGLRAEDNLSEIEKDKFFFLKRVLEQLEPKTLISNFDVELITPSGNNFYLLNKGNSIPKNLTKVENLNTEWDGENLWLLNIRNERLFTIPYTENEGEIIPNITIYNDFNGVQIIETDKLDYFLDSLNYTSVRIGSAKVSNEGILNLIGALQNSSSPLIRSLLESLGEDGNSLVTNLKLYRTNFNKLLKQLKDGLRIGNINVNELSPFFKLVIKNSLEVHTSFLKSLEYIVSRTPALSHQSFMAMKVVGFDNRGLNSAYVSRWQIWLQGSDYDIDKASVLGYQFNRGKYIGWSNFFNYDSIEKLKESEKLPFPNGKELERLSEEQINARKVRAFDYMVVKDIDLISEPNKITYTFGDGTKVEIPTNYDGEHYTYNLIENLEIINTLNPIQKYLLANALKNKLNDLDIVLLPKSNSGYNFEKLGIDKEGVYNSMNTDYTYDIAYYLLNIADPGNLAEFINILSSLGFVPHNDILTPYFKEFDVDNLNILNDFAIVNMHNLYFEDPKNKGLRRDALMNFISSVMALASSSPENLILGQSGVDSEVDKTSAILKRPEFSKLAAQTQFFDRGAVTSKFRLLVLTLAGKENVGVVASAMKVFEAMSLYYYLVLNRGSKKELEALLSNLQLMGRNIRLIANSAVRNKVDIKSLAVLDALNEVDNDLDAFLLFSAFLSMATDNAKDPKLAKINAGPEMMGIYTAGFVLGVDLETLISIALSETGLVISQLQGGNVFEENLGFNRISQAIQYLLNGPNLNYLKGESDIINVLGKTLGLPSKESKGPYKTNYQAVVLAINSLSFKGKKTLIKSLRGYLSKNEEKLEVNLDALVYNVRRRLKRELAKKRKSVEKLNLKEQTKGALTEKENARRNNYNVSISQLQEHIEICGLLLRGLIKPENIENNDYLKNLFSSNIIDFKETLKSFKEYNFESKNKRELLRKLCLDIELHLYYTEKILGDYMTDDEGNQHEILSIIKTLDNFNLEMGTLRGDLKLNLGLPNGIEDQLSFISSFESGFKTFWTEAKETPLLKALKEVNTKLLGSDIDPKNISLKHFVLNTPVASFLLKEGSVDGEYLNYGYRDLVQDAYEGIKIGVNIYKVMWDIAHYRGYLETVAVLQGGLESVMGIYKKSNEAVNIVNLHYGQCSAADAIKRNKATTNFIIRKMNNIYLHTILLNINGNNIMLGTKEGNAAFRKWMEIQVFPEMSKTLSLNEFVKSLTTTVYNFNPRHNTTINYTSKVSMSPRSDYEIVRFSKVKLAFNRLLSKDLYNCGYSLVDLIFFYNLIAYNGTSGRSSFTNLFEDIIINKGSAAINNYNKYISLLDLNPDVNFKLSSLDILELLVEAAPVVTISDLLSGKKKPIKAWVLDEKTFKFHLVERIDRTTTRGDIPEYMTEEFMGEWESPDIPDDVPMDENIGGEIDEEIVSNRKGIREVAVPIDSDENSNIYKSFNYKEVAISSNDLISPVLDSYDFVSESKLLETEKTSILSLIDDKKIKRYNNQDFEITLSPDKGEIKVKLGNHTFDEVAVKLIKDDNGILYYEVDLEKTLENDKNCNN